MFQAFAASLVIISNIATTYYGSSKHIEYVDPSKLPDIFKAYLAADVMWAAANTSIRVSIVHFYITLFRSNKKFLRAAYAILILVIAFGVGIVISNFLTCRPLAKYWDPLLPGVCENLLGSIIALSSCNVAMDLTIVLLPMPMVWGLQMATRRKLELTIIFALGFVVCAITIIRLVLSIHLNLDDFTYSIAKIGIVTTLEPLLGIIIACLPFFPPALKKMSGHMKTKPEIRNVLSSAMARLRSKRSEHSNFQRFDDSYALTDLENNNTHNHITGISSEPDSLDRDYRELAGAKAPPQSATKVDVGWEVRSDEAGNLGEKL